MSDIRWDNVGDKIRDSVDDAINRNDFSDLSGRIHRMINSAMDSIGVSGSGSGSRVNGAQPGAYSHVTPKPPTRLYVRHAKGKVSGKAMSALGWVGVFIFGICFLCSALFFAVVAAIVFAALTALFLAMALLGISKQHFSQRFTLYTSVIRNRTVVPLEELAAKVDQSIEFVADDLQKMITERLFFQAHVDMDSHSLILTDAAYQDYLAAKDFADRRQLEKQAEIKRQERKEREQAEKAAKLSPECQSLIAEGQDYIRYIHESNERIPGAGMTGKLTQMESLITRIFETVRLHPDVAGDLNKLMSYYLPTTKKLLDTYQELDYQAPAGENIISTKAEIEDAVDALNAAFEKLLDGLYESRAWDVSSDISVLKTVLAQDGLGEDGLRAGKKV